MGGGKRREVEGGTRGGIEKKAFTLYGKTEEAR